ncbi:MAG: hypothetical protein OMM_10753 [Candidatus Magnetoglobus multicellularis str. Araruama]|uniref:Uncharacterized protein TP-0789 domain-containing protein n=1 Tax=Candidatus Magnetoglobus multicellularis str. Araruama TaxID=890399 RepID=A0A1V1P059_9BACT|nr:MAG: hypothetical protein OMM_10753 [Candidatus Magnetoglobus multicellularis str. Araruama]
MKHYLIIATILFYTTCFSFAQDAKDIMQKVIDRNDGTTEIARVRLSTCRVVKKGRKLVCADSPRIKILDMVRKDYGPKEKDHKTVSIIIEPAAEKGIGFLQYDYDQPGKDTDQWLYLSALGKVKRIVSGNDNEPKTGSFFGTEFTYEDMESIHLEDYSYKILGSETYQKRSCWVIESIPGKQRAKKSNYSRMMDWIDKKRFIALKSILFNRQGKKLKKIYNNNIEIIDSILVPRKIIVYNLESGRRTFLTYEKVAFNKPVSDDFLTQRTLIDGVFRESTLKQYQLHLK